MAFIDFAVIRRIVSPRYLGSTLLVLILFTPALLYVWNKYEQVQLDFRKLAEERIAFANNRADVSASQAASSMALKAHESSLGEREKALATQTAIFEQEKRAYHVAESKLTSAAALVGRAQRTADAEKQLQVLMTEFSQLGVNLNEQPCGENPKSSQYAAAKAKYSQALALAEANGIYERFRAFFDSNAQSRLVFCAK